jgi:hypothetical protein
MKSFLKSAGLGLVILQAAGCGDGKWGKEDELSGSWSGSAYFNSGGSRTGLSLRLNEGRVVSGRMDMGLMELSNLAGDYFYDGNKLLIDFSNASPDLCGTCDGTSMSGNTCDDKGNDEGGTFRLTRN